MLSTRYKRAQDESSLRQADIALPPLTCKLQFALGIVAESPQCSIAKRGLAADSPAGGNALMLVI